MKYSDLKDNIAKNDHAEKAVIGDTRKVKLTLRHLNKLRKMREIKNLEKINMARQLEIIYSMKPEGSEPSFG